MITRHIARWFAPASDSRVAEHVRLGKSPWLDCVHLIWSFWIFVVPLFNGGLSGYNSTWLVLTATSYPVFLLLFAKAQLAPRRTAHFYALAMAAMSLATLRWYPSGLSYFIYGCIMLRPGGMSLRAYYIRLAVLNVSFVTLAWSIGFPLSLLIIIPISIFAVSTITAIEQMSQESDAALRLSHDEVRRLAATAERERIGRDLHDLLGHTLSLITLKLELSRKLFDRDVAAAKREVVEAEKVARLALAEVRSAVSGIRAADLAAELASAQLLLESSRVHVDYDQPPADLPQETERAFSLVLREAATNIARHAEASAAKVEFRREQASFHMLISDNGRGGIDGDGNGLRGMRERMQAIGGTLQLSSPRRGGTRLIMQAPVPALRLVPSSALTLPADELTCSAASGHSVA